MYCQMARSILLALLNLRNQSLPFRLRIFLELSPPDLPLVRTNNTSTVPTTNPAAARTMLMGVGSHRKDPASEHPARTARS